ncbi:MAG TPA: hypothetical protein VKX25_00130 [Bryobacteraceae bacterium]|jgi:hypothetical protein|nr:hypothetical protein [Bryobacteraceae bacterium]
MRALLISAALFILLPAVQAQQQAPPTGQQDSNAWVTKTIELKYLDPEQLRSLFSNQSYVMEANRELKVLKISGPQSFVKQVEDAGTQLDVAPAAPADIQVTVYLLATTGKPLPDELKSIDPGLSGLTNSQQLKLADSQVLRLREGQTGEVALTDTKAAPGPALTRVRVQSAIASTDSKPARISLDGVRCWIVKPPASGDATPPAPHADADFIANIDVVPNQTAVLAEAGTEKPIVLAVRATVAK